MTPKRALIIIARLDVGGAEHLALLQIRELEKRGWKVHLLTFLPELDYSLIGNVPPECQRHWIKFYSLYNPRSWREVIRLFREVNPSLIMTHLWFANTIGRIAARITRMHKLVLSFEHNIYDELKTRRQFLADRFLQNWCRWIVAVSGAVRDSLLAHGISEKRIAIVENAIDIEKFQRARPSNIRSELHLEGSFIYLFAGRLNRQKGVDVLLHAFKRLREGVLLIAGQGESRADLEKLARSLNISHRVFFLGVRSDIPVLMKSADCFVMSSRWEGFGLVLIEAMAAGIPVICTDFPAAHSILEKNVTALLVRREDANELAGAMEKMYSDKNMRRSLSLNASVEIERFSPEQHVNKLLALLEK